MTDQDAAHEFPGELAGEWRADAIRIAQRPEEYWTSQEMRIRARIHSHPVRRPRSMWLAVATASVVFLAVMLIAPGTPYQQRAPIQATIDADQELLIAVERALAARTPESLEPLTLVVESSSNHNVVEPITHKEHRNED